MVRAHTRRFNVVSLKGGYHGMTYQVMGMTSLNYYKYPVASPAGFHNVRTNILTIILIQRILFEISAKVLKTLVCKQRHSKEGYNCLCAILFGVQVCFTTLKNPSKYPITDSYAKNDKLAGLVSFNML